MPQSAFFCCLFKLKRITLQYRIGFYQTSTWISHRFTYVPSHWRSAPLRITIAHLFMAPEGGENTLVKGRRMFSLEAQWDSALLATLLLLLNSPLERESSLRHPVHRWACLCYNRTLFTIVGSGLESAHGSYLLGPCSGLFMWAHEISDFILSAESTWNILSRSALQELPQDNVSATPRACSPTFNESSGKDGRQVDRWVTEWMTVHWWWAVGGTGRGELGGVPRPFLLLYLCLQE